MLNFITIVLAIVVAQVLLLAGYITLMLNKRFMKAYMRWFRKMAEDISEELLDEYLEEEES